MIKEEIRSLVRNELQKLDKTACWHDRFIDASIEKTLNEMYWDVFASDPLALQRFVKRYGYITAILVSYENTTGLYYSDFPAPIVPFLDKSSGVRRISTPLQSGASFYPMDSREHDLIMSGSYTDTVTSKIGFSVTDRIEYFNMSASVVLSGVRMDCIVPFSAYTDEEVVLLPEIRGQGDDAFLDRVLMHLREVPEVELNENTKQEVK